MSAAHKIPAWTGPVTFVCLLLGFLIVSAISTQNKAQTAGTPSRYSFRSGSAEYKSVLDEKDQEIAKLRQENQDLLAARTDNSQKWQLLNQGYLEARTLAGLTEVEGPGVEITLQDSENHPGEDPGEIDAFNIHDDDVLKVVNECWQSGAEAIAVHNQRVIAGTGIRCEGPVIYVGRVPVSSPVVIRAIGDPETLYGALNMKGRWIDKIRTTDPKMAELKKLKTMRIPAYTGSTERRFLKPEDKG
ncbi:MAG: DUF881 domain-containing protein [Fimbriimonadales bacterium]